MITEMSLFDCEKDALFAEVMKSASFFYVSRPMVMFKADTANPIPEIWAEGQYLVSMKLFGFVPLGKQWINISIDKENCHLRDDGHSALIEKWLHNIYISAAERGKTLYVDVVEIDAGPFTPLVFLYAKAFFRHRQRRWHKLIDNGFGHRETSDF